MVLEEVIENRRNLYTVWLDYQKAFDSVPHSWLIKALELSKVPTEIVRTIKMLCSKWKTTLNMNSETESITTEEIEFRRGIFQGDSLSVILFILSVNPLSFLLKKCNGYSLV